MAKSFVKGLGHVIAQEFGNTIEDAQLKDSFVQAIGNLPDGKLKQELNKKFEKNFKRLQSCLKEEEVTELPPISNGINESLDELTKEELGGRKDVTEQSNQHGVQLYNLYETKKKLKVKQMKKLTNSERIRIYRLFLKKLLDNNGVADTLIEGTITDFKDICDFTETDTKVNFDWLPVCNTILELTSGCKPLAFIRVLRYLFNSIQNDVNNCLAKEKAVRSGRLSKVVKNFIITSHLEVSSKISQTSESKPYYQLMSALLSIYVDLCAVHSSKVESKSDYDKDIAGFVGYILYDVPESQLEVLLQLSCWGDDNKFNLLWPLLNKCLEVKPQKGCHSYYLKYVLLVRQVKDSHGDIDQIIKWNLLTKSIPASDGFLEWLNNHCPEAYQYIPTDKKKFKRTMVTKFLLEEAEDDLVTLLLDSFGGDVKKEDNDTETEKTLEEITSEELFYLDTGTQKSGMSTGEEKTEDSDNDPIIIKTLEEMQRLINEECDTGTPPTDVQGYKLDKTLSEQITKSAGARKFFESEIVSITALNTDKTDEGAESENIIITSESENEGETSENEKIGETSENESEKIGETSENESEKIVETSESEKIGETSESEADDEVTSTDVESSVIGTMKLEMSSMISDLGSITDSVKSSSSRVVSECTTTTITYSESTDGTMDSTKDSEVNDTVIYCNKSPSNNNTLNSSSSSSSKKQKRRKSDRNNTEDFTKLKSADEIGMKTSKEIETGGELSKDIIEITSDVDTKTDEEFVHSEIENMNDSKISNESGFDKMLKKSSSSSTPKKKSSSSLTPKNEANMDEKRRKSNIKEMKATDDGGSLSLTEASNVSELTEMESEGDVFIKSPKKSIGKTVSSSIQEKFIVKATKGKKTPKKSLNKEEQKLPDMDIEASSKKSDDNSQRTKSTEEILSLVDEIKQKIQTSPRRQSRGKNQNDSMFTDDSVDSERLHSSLSSQSSNKSNRNKSSNSGEVKSPRLIADKEENVNTKSVDASNDDDLVVISDSDSETKVDGNAIGPNVVDKIDNASDKDCVASDNDIVNSSGDVANDDITSDDPKSNTPKSAKKGRNNSSKSGEVVNESLRNKTPKSVEKKTPKSQQKNTIEVSDELPTTEKKTPNSAQEKTLKCAEELMPESVQKKSPEAGQKNTPGAGPKATPKSAQKKTSEDIQKKSQMPDEKKTPEASQKMTPKSRLKKTPEGSLKKTPTPDEKNTPKSDEKNTPEAGQTVTPKSGKKKNSKPDENKMLQSTGKKTPKSKLQTTPKSVEKNTSKPSINKTPQSTEKKTSESMAEVNKNTKNKTPLKDKPPNKSPKPNSSFDLKSKQVALVNDVDKVSDSDDSVITFNPRSKPVKNASKRKPGSSVTDEATPQDPNYLSPQIAQDPKKLNSPPPKKLDDESSDGTIPSSQKKRKKKSLCSESESLNIPDLSVHLKKGGDSPVKASVNDTNSSKGKQEDSADAKENSPVKISPEKKQRRSTRISVRKSNINEESAQEMSNVVPTRTLRSRTNSESSMSDAAGPSDPKKLRVSSARKPKRISEALVSVPESVNEEQQTPDKVVRRGRVLSASTSKKVVAKAEQVKGTRKRRLSSEFSDKPTDVDNNASNRRTSVRKGKK